jgi:maleylacetate reductase
VSFTRSVKPFSLVDGERVVRFGDAVQAAPVLLPERGFAHYALLTTERTLPALPSLAEGAAVVVHVPHGLVADAAAAVRDEVAGRPLVALGGGRVIDTAKAIGALERALRPEGVAAIPTTLAGAELTPTHRLLPGTEGGPVRPSLALCDPALMASQPLPELAASAMNALAHALEATWNANRTPISDPIAARGAALLVGGLATGEPDRPALALGAVHAAWAFGLVGAGVHHVVCQTLVQALGLPHALVNAIVLPHSRALMAPQTPDGLRELDVAGVARRAGATGLRELGTQIGEYRSLVPAMQRRPELARCPDVTADDLVALVEAAW